MPISGQLNVPSLAVVAHHLFELPLNQARDMARGRLSERFQRHWKLREVGPVVRGNQPHLIEDAVICDARTNYVDMVAHLVAVSTSEEFDCCPIVTPILRDLNLTSIRRNHNLI